MFAALGRLAARRPGYVVGVWILLAVIVVILAPGLKSTTDQSDFLPKHYESIRAAQVMADALPKHENAGATIVFSRTDGQALTGADKQAITTIAGKVKLGSDFTQVEAPAYPPGIADPKVAIVNIDQAKGITGQSQSELDQIPTMRTDLQQLTAGTGLRAQTTGTLPENYDQSKSGQSAEAIIMLATILLIIVLLGFIFRSVLAAITPIILVAIVFMVSNGAIGAAAQWFNLKVDTSLQVILGVVLFGIGTDYFLFFLFRYREARRNKIPHHQAVETAVTRAGEAIASAGGAVIVAFSTLSLSSLGMFKSMGPALAIAVAIMLLAALTLVPATVTLLNRALFWPSKKWQLPSQGSRFDKMGKSLGKRPAAYAVATGGALVVLTLFCFVAGGFKPTFDLSSSNSSTTTESAQATKMMENNGFSAGATQPTPIVVTSTSPVDAQAMETFRSKIAQVPGVAQVAPYVLWSPDKHTALVMATLTAAPSSDLALATVKNDLRPASHQAAPPGTTAYVGGLTSVFVDFQSAMNRDYSVVFPIAAIIIMLILALVLRSLVAPWYLMLSVGLGFGATLGAAVILFQHIKGDPGIIFMLPIMIYLFVVALGTDYNILMISRLREEAREGRDPRDAAAEAVHHAGPTIAVAGVILAGTFASLMLGGNAFLLSMGFSVSFGILIAAFVMAMFFTPALTALIGHAAWWPGHGDAKKATAGEDEAEPELETVG